MGKAMWVVLVIVLVLIVGWYLISPVFNVVEFDDASPLINDALDSMDAETEVDFESQTAEMADVVMEMDDGMDSGASLLASGDFMARAHDVSGKALLIEDGGKKVLRFEDFETGNGPNLHIYLSSSLGNDDFIDLGKIKATKGNVNYELPEGIDTERYDKVLVWCVPFLGFCLVMLSWGSFID